MSAGSAAAPSNPFPGLRPFREEEEYLFFGREAQVDSMVDKLAATHFLAVVGTSGSGKSSLVNCGLVPALHRGLMEGASSGWRVAVLRPGNRPIKAFAEALARPGVLGQPDAEESGFTPEELIEATLRLSKLGLVDAFQEAVPDARPNLLVVVDQFEELFRYRSLAAAAAQGAAAHAGEAATAFVNLLLEVCAHRELPLYVVLTMRSDFLGECAQFFGLPEAINRGQYLVPRMTRDERRSAIAGPLAVCGAQIDPVLLTRLINDVGDDPDQLSILQHALNRTWARWREGGAAGPLALPHYEAAGTMAHALNQHAEEAYGQLADDRQRAVCEALFKAITDKGTDARGTRRPTRMDTLCAITGATAAEVTAVIDVFRDPARAFLMPPAGTALAPETPIDISHESLMRVWDRLRAWSEEEALSAQSYRRLAETAELHAAGKAGLLRQPELQTALEWRQRQQPGASWAARYRPGFEAMLTFLDESKRAFDEETRVEAEHRAEAARMQLVKRRIRLGALWGVILLVVAAVVYSLYQDAEKAAANAEKAAANAEEAAAKAEKAAAKAELERKEGDARVAKQEAAIAQLTPELRSKIEESVKDRSLVYLQYAEPDQKALAERLSRQMTKAGFAAPGAEQVKAVPARTDLRYFREEDSNVAGELASLLASWNWGSLKPRLVKGFEGKAKPRQLEIWLARPDTAEIERLVTTLNSTDKDERLRAGQALQDRYTASPHAISVTLDLFRQDRINALSNEGRVNALYFLTRTAPLAWDATLEETAREVLARFQLSYKSGDTTDELKRLASLLDAVKAQSPAPPRK